MATQAQQPKREGLSLQTLLIASAASLTAAIVVHKVWQGGAILGAAITPVIVAVVSEALKKPAEALTTAKPRVTPATSRRTPTGTRVHEPAGDPRDPGLPPPSYARPKEDRFGIWEADKPAWHERLTRRHLKIALVTGLVAFAIAAVFLTGANLVTGGAGGGDRFTLLPGKQERSDREERERREREPQTTQPVTPAPDSEEPQDTPQPTPTTPDTEEPAPTTPAPTTPAPTTPAPPTGGEQAPAP